MRVVGSPSTTQQAVRDLLQEASVFHDAAQGKADLAVGDARRAIRDWVGRYLGAWEHVTGRTPRTDYKAAWVVREAYWKTPRELEKRLKKDAFYRANVHAICSECDQLLDPAPAVPPPSVAGEEPGQRERVLGRAYGTMASATELLQSFCFRCGLELEPSVFDVNVHHHRDLYQCVLCLWHGLPYQDPWSATAMLRQAIELRLRHAVDVIGVAVDGQPKPISLAEILDALAGEVRAGGIDSEVPMFLVKRLYQWASVFVHTGFGQYPWLAGFAIHYLEPLMCGIPQQDGSWSVDNAVRVEDAAKERICRRIIRSAARRYGVPVASVRVYSLGLDRPGRLARHLARQMAEVHGSPGCDKSV